MKCKCGFSHSNCKCPPKKFGSFEEAWIFLRSTTDNKEIIELMNMIENNMELPVDGISEPKSDEGLFCPGCGLPIEMVVNAKMENGDLNVYVKKVRERKVK